MPRRHSSLDRTRIRRTPFSLVIALLVCIVSLPLVGASPAIAQPAAFTGPDGGASAAGWAAAQDGPQPFDGIDPELAVPITMDDGTVLKADIYHPSKAGKRADGRTPVVLQLQGYGKALVNAGEAILKIPGIEQVLLPFISQFDAKGTGLQGITDFTRQLDTGALRLATHDWELAKGGYTLVQVDIRGTGTSQGQWQLFGDRERKDATEIADWINTQRWSNGNIGLTGTSFTSINALDAAATGHPSFKAVFAFESSMDETNDIVAPGGGIGVGFLPIWLVGVNLAKMVPDIEALIAGRFDPAQELQWVRDRLADPLTFLDVVANVFTATTTDQLTARTTQFISKDSALRRGLQADPAKVTAPTFMIGGNSDIFGPSQTMTYNKLPMPLEKKKLIYGDGFHLGEGVQGFGHPGMPPRLDVLQRAWFDKWLRGIDNGIDHYSPMTLKQPDGPWATTTQFPRAGVQYRRMYLSDRSSGSAPHAVADGSLLPEPSTGARDLTVAPSLLSICSRDAGMGTAGITSVIVACTEDSRIRERAGLAFSTDPVVEPTTISGPIAVHLNTVHDTKDGYWTVTVNDVGPDGRSRQISSGQLVSSLRKIDESQSIRAANGDYTRPVPTIDLADRATVTPGQPVTLDIAANPIDTTLQPGHRLRVDVFASNFPKGLPPTPVLVDSKLAPQHLRLDPATPSWVNLPMGLPVR